MKLKDLNAQQVHERVQAFVKAIQQTLRDHSDADPRLTGMGTTFTAVYIMGHDAVVSQIGDSRAYLFRAGGLIQITKDQTLAQRMIELGCQPEQVAGLHNVLANCLCADGTEAHAEIHHITLRDGDILLLCTDGLTSEVSDDEIRDRLAVTGRRPQQACDELASVAVEHGGRDNVTVIVATVASEPALRKNK
jgi:protein phosphatase